MPISVKVIWSGHALSELEDSVEGFDPNLHMLECSSVEKHNCSVCSSARERGNDENGQRLLLYGYFGHLV